MSKGSKQRPFNKAKFDQNFDAIFRKELIVLPSRQIGKSQNKTKSAAKKKAARNAPKKEENGFQSNIFLPNRYGDRNYLAWVKENTWEFKGDDHSSSLRLGGKEGAFEAGEFDFLDPSGGPFIQLGTSLSQFGGPELKVTRIFRGESGGIMIEVE